MTDVSVMAGGLMFPEGPIAMPDGSVILVEIAGHRLSRVHPGGRTEVVAETGGGPNGAAFGPDGRVYVCNNGGFDTVEKDGRIRIAETLHSYVGGSVQAVDIETGDVETLYREVDGEPLKGPNDLVFDRDGRVLVHRPRQDPRTVPGPGRALLRPAGRLGRAGGDLPARRAERGGPLPRRGLALRRRDPHRSGASVAGGGARPARHPLRQGDPRRPRRRPARRAAPRQPRRRLGEGHVCVATIRNGGITDIDPADGSTVHVPTGDPLTTNVCFGGPELRTAYITCSLSGTLVTTPWERPGLALNFNPY